jgi:phosphate transport system permease protein
MTAVNTRPSRARHADPGTLRLAGVHLPRWAAAFCAASGAGLALAARAAFGWSGWTTTTVAAVVLFITLLTAWSFRVEGRRRAKDRLASTVIYACMLAAVTPLLLILGYIAAKGAPALSWTLLTHSMNGVTASMPGGGVYAAFVGTLQQVGVASLIALPLGVLTAVYLVEYARGGPFARAVTFFVDVMTGVPSIVAGLFVYSFLLLGTGLRPFGAAGSLALALLMLPVVIRAGEEMLRLVPDQLREASYALGVPKWRTVLKVVLPTALSGLITSCLLAIARVTGETAPLILLVGYSSRINNDPFSGDQASLPMFIWDQLGKRTGNSGTFSEPRAWAAALVLVLLVLVINVVAHVLAALAKPKST